MKQALSPAKNVHTLTGAFWADCLTYFISLFTVRHEHTRRVFHTYPSHPLRVERTHSVAAGLRVSSAQTKDREDTSMSAAITQTTADGAAAPPVLRHDRDGIATLTLNRPEARNALSVALMAALQAELDAIHEDPSVRVVVLAGAGPAFCAGHDLKEVRADTRRETYEALFAQCARLMMTITRIRQPVIARVHGIATAAGCQLVASCDLAYAADTARFATPGVNIGLFCSTPMVALTRAIGRKAAMEMLLLGDLIAAEEAERIGLVNKIVPAEHLDAAIYTVASRIASKSPLTLSIGKEAFYRQIELPTEQAYAYAAEVMTRNMLAQDAAEGIDAFLQKRDPVWCGR